MKKFFRIISLVLVFIIAFTISIPKIYSAGDDKSITILFTYDMHDHFYPFNVEEDRKILSVGGYAKLYNAIEKEHEKDPELLQVEYNEDIIRTPFEQKGFLL